MKEMKETKPLQKAWDRQDAIYEHRKKQTKRKHVISWHRFHNRNTNPLPSFEELHRLFEYEPLTGDIFWRNSKKGRKMDSPIGYYIGRWKYLRIDGLQYSVARIIYAMHNRDCGYYFEIRHKDGDYSNTAIENLEAEYLTMPTQEEEELI